MLQGLRGTCGKTLIQSSTRSSTPSFLDAMMQSAHRPGLATKIRRFHPFFHIIAHGVRRSSCPLLPGSSTSEEKKVRMHELGQTAISHAILVLVTTIKAVQGWGKHSLSNTIINSTVMISFFLYLRTCCAHQSMCDFLLSWLSLWLVVG